MGYEVQGLVPAFHTLNPIPYTLVHSPMPSSKQKNTIVDTPSFESEFERLATIVDKLEQGNVPLAEMLTLYEEAMALSAKLKEELTQAELRVEKLAAVHEEGVIEFEERGEIEDADANELF